MAAAKIEAIGITKSFGSVAALDGVDLSVDEGKILGLLGHNGAGKTTLVNILTTLLPPTKGIGRICGFDVTTDGHEVRRRIGLTGQFAAVDENLSGRDNLVLVARLLGASRRQAAERTTELLETFDLTEAANRVAKEYSGGMRRRLDVAASLVGRPEVIFLDEPTTGLDPTGRKAVWDIVERLAGQGTTVLLTTQYLEEADQLADSITVLSKGMIVAKGTAAELKAEIGQRTVTVTLESVEDGRRAVDVLAAAGLKPNLLESRSVVSVPATAPTTLATVVRALDDANLIVAELGFAEPTLDDVYVALTHAAPPESTEAPESERELAR